MTAAFPAHMPEEMEICFDAPTLEELFKEYDEVIELKISDLETMRENLLKIRRKSK
jgi:predicted RNase H-like HicB family nuclease